METGVVVCDCSPVPPISGRIIRPCFTQASGESGDECPLHAQLGGGYLEPDPPREMREQHLSKDPAKTWHTEQLQNIGSEIECDISD